MLHLIYQKIVEVENQEQKMLLETDLEIHQNQKVRVDTEVVAEKVGVVGEVVVDVVVAVVGVVEDVVVAVVVIVKEIVIIIKLVGV